MTEKRICEVCGVEFKPKSPSQRVCSKAECQKERRRQYMRKNADLYRELNRMYRQREEVKQYRAEYDKEYQKTHKEQIREYKRMWWKRKMFFKHYEQGEIIKNMYWFSLSQDEQKELLDRIKVSE